MSSTSIFSKIESWIHAASRWGNRLSSLTLLLLMLFISADVIKRYVFTDAIIGSIDFVTVAMVVLVFPSFGIVTMGKGHVCSDFVYNLFHERFRGIVDLFTGLCSIIIVVLITWKLGDRVLENWQSPQGLTTQYFQWPQLPFIFIAFLGCLMMSLELVISFLHKAIEIKNTSKLKDASNDA